MIPLDRLKKLAREGGFVKKSTSLGKPIPRLRQSLFEKPGSHSAVFPRHHSPRSRGTDRVWPDSSTWPSDSLSLSRWVRRPRGEPETALNGGMRDELPLHQHHRPRCRGCSAEIASARDQTRRHTEVVAVCTRLADLLGFTQACFAAIASRRRHRMPLVGNVTIRSSGPRATRRRLLQNAPESPTRHQKTWLHPTAASPFPCRRCRASPRTGGRSGRVGEARAARRALRAVPAWM